MSTETQKVDVLAVMDELSEALQSAGKYMGEGAWFSSGEEAAEFRSMHEVARAAVAELIEASHEALAAGVMDINGEPDRLRQILARIGRAA